MVGQIKTNIFVDEFKITPKDEIWLIGKIENGISSFGGMDELYNVRFDKILQNSYINRL